MSFITEIKTFAALGSGVIGSGWVSRALAHGLDVVAWDPAPGAGLRWSFMGTFLTYTLAGGDAGMRHFMAQFGPALQLPWTYLPAPELTDKLIDDVVDGTTDQLGTHSIPALERYRDDCLLAVLEAVKTTKEKHGMTFAE